MTVGEFVIELTGINLEVLCNIPELITRAGLDREVVIRVNERFEDVKGIRFNSDGQMEIMIDD